MNYKKMLSIVLTLVFAFSSFSIVSAEDPWNGMIETNVLQKAVSTKDFGYENGVYNGYIQTNQESEFLSADYIKVVYSIDGEVSDDTEIFTIQPFNTEWNGWQNNFVTPAGSTLENGVYTAYIAMADIKASLSEGSLYGVNVSFMEPSGYNASLTGYYYVSPKPETLNVRQWLGRTIEYCQSISRRRGIRSARRSKRREIRITILPPPTLYIKRRETTLRRPNPSCCS